MLNRSSRVRLAGLGVPAPEDHDLALVIRYWPNLPEPLRAAVLALVRAAQEDRF